MIKETTQQIRQLINEAMQKSQYIKKERLFTTDYFFKKDFRNCSILFAKTSDIFDKRVKREAFKYVELNFNDTSDVSLNLKVSA
tara:strand:- start:204 stop:455 length:252 start_codon:yes stop_codon:yes gene_type:complete